nr:septal ring lytic transglycosylase RlpA family protein [Pseudomonadota bacterium]
MVFKRLATLGSACVLLSLLAGVADGEAASRGTTSAVETGYASVYSEHFNGKNTASGEPYDGHRLTAAHRSLRLGTEVRVTHLGNARSVRVRINDRGPHIAGRIIDLSSGAAAALGL